MATEMEQPFQQADQTSRPAAGISTVASFYEEMKDNVRYRGFVGRDERQLGRLGHVHSHRQRPHACVNGLDFGTTLLFTGACNIITGLLFGVPMPVQPMKSIVAVALTPGNVLTIPQVMAAGITTGGMLVGLGATGLMALVNHLVPLPVVRGIQLSQGLAFAVTAVKYILNFATQKPTSSRLWLGLDSKLLALCFVVHVSGSGDYTAHLFPKDSIEGSNSTNDVPTRRTWRERLRMIPPCPCSDSSWPSSATPISQAGCVLAPPRPRLCTSRRVTGGWDSCAAPSHSCRCRC